MNRRELLQSAPAVAALLSSSARVEAQQGNGAPDVSPTTVYEFRIYHTNEGKLDTLLARFREHTMRIFEKHGMRNVAYWTPTDDPLKGHALYYVLAHKSREAAEASWKAFRDDPEWIKVRDASEANGKLVEKVESTYLALTDFSPRV